MAKLEGSDGFDAKGFAMLEARHRQIGSDAVYAPVLRPYRQYPAALRG